MRKEDKEIVRLTAKEVLFTFFDVTAVMLGVFDKHRIYRKSVYQYLDERKIDRKDFKQKLHYLKKRKLINVFVEGKDKYIELTRHGIDEISKSQLGKIDHGDREWDGKWRIIIFDVPENKRDRRDVFRDKIGEIGFIQIQKSVYVYPYDCKPEIDLLNYYFATAVYIKYMVAEIIEGEADIIDQFIEKGVLAKEDVK